MEVRAKKVHDVVVSSQKVLKYPNKNKNVKQEDHIRLRDFKSVILLIVSEIVIVSIYMIWVFIDSIQIQLRHIFEGINPSLPFLLKSFGFLAFVSIPPLIYVIYWVFKTRSWALRVLAILGFFALFINLVIACCDYECARCEELSDNHKCARCEKPSVKECFDSCCWQAWCCRNRYTDPESEKYLPVQIALLFSIFYGVISVNSCLAGLEIPRKSSFDKSFSFFGIISVFISIAVVLYFSMIEGVESLLKLQFDPFLLSFIFLTIAISSLYIILGYFSQNNCGAPNPSIFSISAITSFSIGTTLSIFILEIEKSIGTLVSHWTFFCVWTILVVSMPILILKNTGGMDKFTIWIFENFLEKEEMKKKKKDIEAAPARTIPMAELAGYQKNAMVSRTVMEKPTGTVTFFAFDEGQRLSEHSTPFDALVYLIDGEAEITISGKSVSLKKGEMVIIPAYEPHAVNAVTKFKMVLTMIRS
jgi:quercetin dioxygenase-like cupin family protein